MRQSVHIKQDVEWVVPGMKYLGVLRASVHKRAHVLLAYGKPAWSDMRTKGSKNNEWSGGIVGSMDPTPDRIGTAAEHSTTVLCGSAFHAAALCGVE
jgi:hypothetical protein